MKIYNSYQEAVGKLEKPIITVGNFDGVHIGHQFIIKQLISAAKTLNGTPAIYTFEPHPKMVLAKRQPHSILTTLADKIELIKSCGIENIIIEKFDTEFANISKDFFLKSILIDKLKIKGILVGYDFRFGKNDDGDTSYVEDFADKNNIWFEKSEPLRIGVEIVNSTLIRKMVVMGEVANIPKYLGRRYHIRGIVGHGNTLGQKIGIPTANIAKVDTLLPKTGVYACKIGFADKSTKNGILNLGFRPSFSGKKLNIEIHIFDFNKSIYGEELKIEFVKFIRDEITFANTNALVDQIKLDINKAKKIISNEN